MTSKPFSGAHLYQKMVEPAKTLHFNGLSVDNLPGREIMLIAAVSPLPS
jgi:hypothetical protein